MLTQDQAEGLAKKAQTVTDNVLKEHYQMFLLDQLYASPLGPSLVFKGGTALRLAYGSFRFSEDLDFTILKIVRFSTFEKSIKQAVASLPEAVLKDMYNKRQTYFAKVVINIPFKPIPLGIKVEINKLKRNVASEPTLLRSPFNNLEVVGRVYTLEQVLTDKLRLLSERREPRDLFDSWYVSQKLNRPYSVNPKDKYTNKELMDGLNLFLPQGKRQILTLFQK